MHNGCQLFQVRLKIHFRQIVIDLQERFGVANHQIEKSELTTIVSERLVLVAVFFQR